MTEQSSRLSVVVDVDNAVRDARRLEEQLRAVTQAGSTLGSGLNQDLIRALAALNGSMGAAGQASAAAAAQINSLTATVGRLDQEVAASRAEIEQMRRRLEDLERQMGGNEDRAIRTGSAFRESFKESANAVALFVSGAVTGLTALAVTTANNAAEIQRLAYVSSLGTTEFQEMAAGAKAFGVEQDKLADILKDTQDKIGDFTQNEAGEVADFFEKILPKVGLTAEAFRNLNGKDALQLYVDSLQKANLSQSEMIFYMESIADDATLLLPLLLDGGKGFDLYADAARNAGTIMDETAIKKSNEMRVATQLLEMQMTGLKNQVAQAVMPVFVDLAGQFGKTTDNGTKAAMVAEVLAASFRGLAAVGVGLVGVLATTGKALGAFAAASATMDDGVTMLDRITGMSKVKQFRNIGEALNTLKIGMSDAISTGKDYKDMVVSILEGGGGNTDQIKAMASLFDNIHTPQTTDTPMVRKADKARADAAAKSAAAAAAAAAKAVEQELARRAKAYEQLSEMSQTDLERTQSEYKERMQLINVFADRSNGEHSRMSDWALQEAKRETASIFLARQQALASYENLNASEIDQIKSKYAFERSEVDLMITYTVDERRKMREALDQAERKEIADNTNALRASFDERYRIELDFNNRIKAIDQSNMSDPEKEMAANVARNVNNDAITGLNKPYTDMMAEVGGESPELLRLKADEEAKMLIIRDALTQRHITEEEAAAARLQIEKNFMTSRNDLMLSQGEQMLGSMTSIMKSLGGEQSKAYKVMFAIEKGVSIARSIMAIQTGIAMASANPFPMNLGAMASVAAATANIVGSLQSVKMAGQAHAGIDYVPKEGTWLLDKGERVLSPKQNSDLTDYMQRDGKSPKSDAAVTGGGLNVTIQNYGTSKTYDVQQISESEVRIIARDEVAKGAGKAAAADLSNPNSEMSKGINRNYQTERRR